MTATRTFPDGGMTCPHTENDIIAEFDELARVERIVDAISDRISRGHETQADPQVPKRLGATLIARSTAAAARTPRCRSRVRSWLTSSLDGPLREANRGNNPARLAEGALDAPVTNQSCDPT